MFARETQYITLDAFRATAQLCKVTFKLVSEMRSLSACQALSQVSFTRPAAPTETASQPRAKACQYYARRLQSNRCSNCIRCQKKHFSKPGDQKKKLHMRSPKRLMRRQNTLCLPLLLHQPMVATKGSLAIEPISAKKRSSKVSGVQ